MIRSAAYCAHPIGDRQLLDESRFNPRISQGEHLFRFHICGGDALQRRKSVDTEAQIHNELPYALNVFPGGDGRKTEPFVTVSDRSVQISAMFMSEEDLVIRLWNSGNETQSATVKIPSLNIEETVLLPGCRFETYLAKPGVGLIPVDPVHFK